jgi:hypothetical protein
MPTPNVPIRPTHQRGQKPLTPFALTRIQKEAAAAALAEEEKRKLQAVLHEALFRYKIAFDSAARKSGAKVRWVSQHSIIWGARGGFREDRWVGICAGLSIEWIKARVAGTDLITQLEQAKTQVMSRLDAAIAPDVVALAKVINKSHERQNEVANKLNGFCEQVGGDTVLSFPFGALKMTKGQYYYLSSSSHAMSAYCDGSTSRFYDPNVGEVHGISTSALAFYFKELVEASALAQGHAISTAAARTITVTAWRSVRP